MATPVVLSNGELLTDAGQPIPSSAFTNISAIAAEVAADPAITGLFNPVTIIGITGATAASRLVGATTSGPPLTGTFAVGDVVVARNGVIWVCTVAGTPGTWVDASSSGKELDYTESAVAQGPLTAETTLTLPKDIAFTVAAQPVYVEAEITDLYSSTAALACGIYITDAANTKKTTVYESMGATGIAVSVRFHERISTPGDYVRRLRVARVSGTGSWNTNLDTGCRVSLGAYTR